MSGSTALIKEDFHSWMPLKWRDRRSVYPSGGEYIGAYVAEVCGQTVAITICSPTPCFDPCPSQAMVPHPKYSVGEGSYRRQPIRLEWIYGPLPD